MRSTSRSFVAALLALACFVASCAGPTRRETVDQVRQRLAEYDDFVTAQRDVFSDTMLKRLELKYEISRHGGTPFVYDVLALSSGGQYGAFGVGVLQGWESVPDGPDAIPEFDVVTGVSTGALIAPFAFVGTSEYIKRVDQLYQEIDDRFVAFRDLFFFLPWRVSWYDNSRLVDRIETEINDSMLDRVAACDRDHRLLLIGTTDVDLGRMRVWNLGAVAQEQPRSAALRRSRKVLLASAAIPAAFPPVEIDGALFVDGGVSQQAFAGLDREQIESVVNRFTAAHPGASPPEIRFWMIVNTQLDLKPEVVPYEWLAGSGRSLDIMMRYAMRTTLRHLEFGAETLARRLNTKVQFRYMCVPDSVSMPKTKDLFERHLMDELVKVGREMGANPKLSWRSEVASVEMPHAH